MNNCWSRGGGGASSHPHSLLSPLLHRLLGEWLKLLLAALPRTLCTSSLLLPLQPSLPGGHLVALTLHRNKWHPRFNKGRFPFTETSSFFKSHCLRHKQSLLSPTGQSSMFDNVRYTETFKYLGFLYPFQKRLFHLYANGRDLYICFFSHTALPTSPSFALPRYREGKYQAYSLLGG